MAGLDRESARERAVKAIAVMAERQCLSDVVIVDSGVVETETAWYFPYNSAAYLERGDMRLALYGNVPVMVPKDGGEVTFRSP